LRFYRLGKNSSSIRSNHSPLEGESQSQLVGDAVRGQKSLDNQEIDFFEVFLFLTFDIILKLVVIVSFLTPHDSRNLTTVKFLESALPQGESYSPNALKFF
jgi:hypothetical protein